MRVGVELLADAGAGAIEMHAHRLHVRLAIEELGQLADRRQVQRIDLQRVAQGGERVAGVLEALLVDLGDAVQVGDALVRIGLEAGQTHRRLQARPSTPTP